MSSIEQLFADHRKFLWSLSYRMTGSAADADDVVQDTFVRAMEHPPRRMEDPLRPWLVKVALNLSRDVLRRRCSAHLALEDQVEARGPQPRVRIPGGAHVLILT